MTISVLNMTFMDLDLFPNIQMYKNSGRNKLIP